MAAAKAFTERPNPPAEPLHLPAYRRGAVKKPSPLRNGAITLRLWAEAHSAVITFYRPRAYLFLCFKSTFQTKSDPARRPQGLLGRPGPTNKERDP